MIKDKLESLQQQISVLVARDSFSEQQDTTQTFLKPSSICSPRSNQTLPSPAALSQYLVGQSPKIAQNSHGSGESTRSYSTLDIADDLSVGRPNVSTKKASAIPGGLAVTCHPLLAISQPEALRLIEVYEDECGSAYPFIDIGNLRYFATNFYDRADVSRKPATWRAFQVDKTSKRSFNTLEMVLAISLMIEGHGSSDLATALVDELEAEIDHRPSGTAVDIPFTEILSLMVCTYLPCL